MAGPVGFVIPLAREAHCLLDSLADRREETVRQRKFIRGRLAGRDCVVTISGAGKVQSASATQQLLDLHDDCVAIIHLGSGGALSGELKLGDFVLGAEVIEHDWVVKFGGSRDRMPVATSDPGWLRRFEGAARVAGKRAFTGKIVSGTEDIVTSARRDELFSRYGALSVDWESYACAHVANFCQVPCVVLRAISDYAYEHTEREFRENVKDVSAEACRLAIAALAGG